MPKIVDIRCYTVAPRWIFVRVESEDGQVGWGESIVPKRKAAVVSAVGDLARNIVGLDAFHIEDISRRMRKGAFFRHGPVLNTAAAGIEIALWDLKGKSLDLPVHQFLGGPVRKNVRSYAWIGGDSPDSVVAHAHERIAQGFDAVKMNATAAVEALADHAAIDAMVARLGALRDAFGQSLDIALDLHGRVGRSVLKPLVREIEQFRLMWVEEAVLPENEEALEVLARVCPNIPVATGERLVSRWEFKRLLDSGAVDIVQPDVSITGLFELEKIARLAEIYDVAVAPHCPNGPISLAASLQVGFCCANVVIQEQSLGLHYNQGYAGLPRGELKDYLTDTGSLTTDGGRIALSRAPGLGLALNEEAIVAAHTDWTLPDSDWLHADGVFAEW